MSKQCLLVIDQGTTSTRAIAFSLQGAILAVSQQEITQHFPQPGWVEHCPEEIINKTLAVCREVVTKVKVDNVVAIGITNQRETTIVWDRKTGKPIHKAIVWQDRRTSDTCEKLSETHAQSFFQAKTGLLLDPYFSATKVAWLLDHVDGAREKASRAELAFGTVDCYLLWHLTGGNVHATDATNAARTLLYNIHEGQWDNDLCECFRVPDSLLPEVRDNTSEFGEIDPALLGKAIPITAMIGDQQGALIGQCCFTPGMVKSTYGTGCFVVMNTGNECVTSSNRLLSTIGYQLKGKVTYALEGSIFNAGTSVQWLRDSLCLIQDAAESESLASGLSSNEGVYLVPAFTGLGAPYWDPHARAAILGLTRDTGIAHIVRASLEAVCYQTRDLLLSMIDDLGHGISTVRVDGGMAVNDWLMQFLADIDQVSVARPEVTETTALGAAFLAGLGAGVYQSLDEVSRLWQADKVFEPVLAADKSKEYYRGWQQAVARVTVT